MIVRACKTLGLTANIKVSENAEEFNKLAGSPDACHNEALNNVLYRSTYPELRAQFCEALEKKTGIARGTKDSDKEGSKSVSYTETEQVYYNRLLGAGHISEEDAQELMDAVAASVEFDPSPSRRRSAAPKEVLAAAEEIVNAVGDNTEAQARSMSKFEAALDLNAGGFIARFGAFGLESVVAALLAHKEKMTRDMKNFA